MGSDGLVLIDKPPGWTSHDVVARTRRLAGTRKVGHAGTLDPMATGLLVLGINRATRLLTYIVGADKTYTATIRLGQATTTDDAEGEFSARMGARQVDPEHLTRAIASLTGAIEQVPSAVSAIKVDGKRAYARVRAGEQVELPKRPVTVHRFDLLGDPQPGQAQDGTEVLDLPVLVRCSSGTYVRALARDLGEALGTGGHLTALRRTAVGPFEIGGAAPLPEPDPAAEPGSQLSVLGLTTACTALFEVREVCAEHAQALRYGQRIPAQEAVQEQVSDADVGPIAVVSPGGAVVALVQRRGEQYKPLLVFDPA